MKKDKNIDSETDDENFIVEEGKEYEFIDNLSADYFQLKKLLFDVNKEI